MEEKSKSTTQLKKCASLNSLVVQNSPQSTAAPALSSPVHKDHLSLSLLTPRTRRFSCSSNGNGTSNSNSGLASPSPRLAPRITQLRQEECADSVQSREANHEREVHSALSMSQSYEDLTLVMNENWSFKNTEEFSNPLHVSCLPASNSKCSSPSPTSSRHNMMRSTTLQYGMSPSPTRRSFATRRSMSPIAIRPSPLGSVVGSVKRKFDMIDDGNSCSSSSSSQQQPYKKFFTESYSRGSSPLPICPSPDSSTANSETFSGRITPKMFITTKAFSSMTSSPLSTHSFENDSPSPCSSTANNIASSSSTGSASSSQSSKDQQERMEVGSCTSGDSGIDASSDVGSSSELLASQSETDTVQNSDSSGVIMKSEEVTRKAEQDQDMIIEEEVSPSNIPMMTL